MRPVVFLHLLTAALACAQTEAALKTFFEGKTVQARIDLPAVKEGVDVYPQGKKKFNSKAYTARMLQFGPAMRRGDSATIARVQVREKNIELELNALAYGTVRDDNSKNPFVNDVPKRGGFSNASTLGTSRFFVWFPPKVLKESIPDPQRIMEILADYVDFGRGSPSPGPKLSSAAPSASGKLHTGMTESDVLRLFGAPVGSREEMDGGVKVVTNTFRSPGEVIEIDFVKGVVQHFRIHPR